MAYLPLSTANLPDPVIDPAQGSSPEDYFNTVLTTSTGSTLSVDVGFAADFLWTKARNFARSHELHDRVRGDNKRLKSDAATAEESYSNYVVFDADGADLGTNHNLGYHADGTTSGVVWAWKANGTATLNDTGSIDSQVSANTTSGFSIVAWTGDGSETATVGHGLGVEPSCIICKERTGGDWWHVWHKGLSSASHNVFLNNTNAERSPYFDGHLKNNGSSTFGFDSSTSNVNAVNESGITNIAYCFADVEGYSKFGSFSGNNSTDGPFIYLGFRPALFMVKCKNTTGSWYCYDTTRLNYNVMGSQGQPIAWDTTAGEDTGADASWYVDAVSNGIKIRNNSGFDNGTNSFIYMAFAENPFKYSNAR